MTEAMMEKQRLTADEFFAGFLAGLTLRKSQPLTGTRTAMNRAFYRTIQDPNAQFFDLDLLDLDYDVLYGLSPWFDRALTRAQRDLMVSFPNPTYETVEIRLTPREAERLLDEIGHKDDFQKLAELFLANLK
jgi:hypothetical protein